MGSVVTGLLWMEWSGTYSNAAAVHRGSMAKARTQSCVNMVASIRKGLDHQEGAMAENL